MHPMSSTLATMVTRTTATARLSNANAIDAKELEHAIHGGLDELHRTRPRIVTFAPHIALQRVLALPGVRERLERTTGHAMITDSRRQAA
jgi:hypothetical protein